MKQKTKIMSQLLLVGCLLIMSGSILAQDITVKGFVRDQNGEPLIGVNIMIEGTSKGTVTGLEGDYSLSATSDAALSYTYIGYKPLKINIANRTAIDVVLEDDTKVLDEIVVVGYGTFRKKDVTGSVSQVKTEKFEMDNPNTIQDILRGNVAGLNIGYSGSGKGGGAMEIRGRRSISGGLSPLIVLDGVIFDGDMADINPQDIAQVDVLKDASAAAVFGSKSANGVVLITSKKGQSSKPQIKLDVNYGIATRSANSRNSAVYGAKDFTNWRRDVLESSNRAKMQPYQYSDPRNLPDDISVDTWLGYDNSKGDPMEVWLRRIGFNSNEIANYIDGKSVDWEDLVYQNGIRQDYNASLSGKSSGVNYYWSLGYEDKEGIVVGEEYTNFRTRLNLDATVTNFLNVGVRANFAHRDESQVAANMTKMRESSPFGTLYNDKGDLEIYPNNDTQIVNPLYDMQHIDRMKKFYTLNATIFAKVTLPFNITYDMNFTPRYEWYHYGNHQSSAHEAWAAKGGMSERIQKISFGWQIDNIFKWNYTFNKIHTIDATFLVNAEKFQVWRTQQNNEGYDNDSNGWHHMGTGILPTLGTVDESATGDALMGRLHYSLMDRYMVTATVRRDGASAFGRNNPHATFPSIGLAWNVKEEKFMSKFNWLDYSRLRVSWGKNGNSDIGRYETLSSLLDRKYLYQKPDGTLYYPLVLAADKMGNEDLKWETTKALNFGLDVSVFNGRLTANIEGYKMNTNDLLIPRAIPDVTGYTSVITNLGEVQNTGFELSLSSQNIKTKDFEWGTTLNYSLNRNKIKSLYGEMVDVLDDQGNVIGQKEKDDIANKRFIGKDLGTVWEYKVAGVWKTDEAEEAAKYGVQPGDFKLEDIHDVENRKMTNDDKQFLGYTTPRYRWSMRNDFRYRDFNFSFSMYSHWGHIGEYNEAKHQSVLGLDRINYVKLPYWTPDNQIDDYARLNSSNGGYGGYSVYRKKSFIRLDNISLKYTVPSHLMSRFSIKHASLNVSAQNVAVWAPEWDNFDPETGGDTGTIIMFGLNITL